MGSQCHGAIVVFLLLFFLAGYFDVHSMEKALLTCLQEMLGTIQKEMCHGGNRGETWPLSHQARPAHQGDRERLTVDCTVSKQRPRPGLLDCVTLQRTESELCICDSARFGFCFSGDIPIPGRKKKNEKTRFNYITEGSRSFWCSFEVSDQKLDKCMFEFRKQVCFHVWTTCLADRVSAEPTRFLSAALSDLKPSFELLCWKSRNKYRIRPQWPLLTFSEEFITKYPPSHTHTQTLSTCTHRTEQLPCRDCCRKCSISSSGKGSDIWPQGFGKSLCTPVCALLDVGVSFPAGPTESTYLVAPLMFIMESISWTHRTAPSIYTDLEKDVMEGFKPFIWHFDSFDHWGSKENGWKPLKCKWVAC